MEFLPAAEQPTDTKTANRVGTPTVNQKLHTLAKSEELTEVEGEKNAWFLNCSQSPSKGSAGFVSDTATSAK